MINKELLLKGMSYKIENEFEFSMGGEDQKICFLIRPLSDSEASTAQALSLQNIDINALKLKDDTNINNDIKNALTSDTTSQMLKNIADANWFICSKAIIDDSGKSLFSIEEIKTFPAGLPAQIANKIREISGLEIAGEEMSNFRK